MEPERNNSFRRRGRVAECSCVRRKTDAALTRVDSSSQEAAHGFPQFLADDERILFFGERAIPTCRVPISLRLLTLKSACKLSPLRQKRSLLARVIVMLSICSGFVVER